MDTKRDSDRRDGDCYASPNGHRHVYVDGHRDLGAVVAHAHPYADGHRHAYTDPDIDAYTFADGHADTDGPGARRNPR